MWKESKAIIDSDISLLPSELIDKAMQEDVKAIYEIGRIFEKGLLVPMDDAKAYRLFELCSKNKLKEAAIRLAEKTYRGQGTNKNLYKAKEILYEFIEESNIKALAIMGDILYTEGYFSEAILYYTKADNEFQRNAQGVDEYFMAILYGQLVELYLKENEEILNPQKAIYYMDKALKNNVFCNAKEIGNLYFEGKWIERDFKKASNYYKRIASEEKCNGCRKKCNEYCQNQLIKIGFMNRKI